MYLSVILQDDLGYAVHLCDGIWKRALTKNSLHVNLHWTL